MFNDIKPEIVIHLAALVPTNLVNKNYKKAYKVNVIGTNNKDTFQHTIDDLKYHCDILDIMELDHNSVVVIHGGGVNG